MAKPWTWIAVGVMFVGAALLTAPHGALARPAYFKEFGTAYPALKGTEVAKCSICHIGDSKKDRNDYGKAVGSALGAKGVKVPKVILDALKKAESEKSSTEGKTFGDLLKDGQLPGKNP